MKLQKNASQKHCIKCNVILTQDNWINYLQNRGSYICTPCFRVYGKTHHKIDPKYNIKQRNRARMKHSAVIFHYGNQCAKCSEDDYTKLTIGHINRGGNTHRKEINNYLINYLYNNLLDRDGYQVLCYNCNKKTTFKDKYALRDKKKVIEKYGGCCVECKEDRIEHLSMNHKNNDGAKQRRQYGCNTGSRFYRWLIKNNYPDNLGLQVLCFNCNCSKRAIAKYETEEEETSG